MAIQLAQAYVAIVPSMAGVGEAISKAFGGVSASVGAASGKSIGSAITKAVSSSLKTNPLARLEQDVRFAQQDVESAMRSMKTSTLSAQAAQLKYNETVARYGKNSSQAVSAERRLVSAKYSNEDASKRLTSSEKKLQTAQESLSRVRLKGPDTSGAEEKFGSFIQRVKSSFSGLRTSSYGTKAANDFSAAFAAKMGAITGIVSSAMSRVLSSVTSNISDAVSRADTLNNFPKIMSQLGYSATDASSQVQRLSDRITGLPTTLDSIVGSVKRLAPISSSLSNATDIALAFNDAIVAGGASTELQSNAMEQFLQIMSAHKVDLQAWKSIEDAMPGQLTEVARSLLGQSANTMTLYAALRDGSVSMSDFTSKVVELDAKGGAGFSSFENQAKAATSGIGTNMTNLKTAITRGMANVFQAVRPQINGGIQSITGTVNNASKYITTFVSALANTGALQTFGNAASAVGNAVMSVIQPIVQAVAGMLGFNGGATNASGSAKTFASFIKTAAGHLQEFAKWISANKDYLGPLVVGILTAVAAIKIATVAIGIINAVMDANPIMLAVTAIAAVTAALVYFFTQTKTGRKLWAEFMSSLSASLNNIRKWFGDVANWISSKWNALTGVFKSFGSGIGSAMQPGLDRVRNAWNRLWNTLGPIVMPILNALGAFVKTWVAVFATYWSIQWTIMSGAFRTAWNMLVAFIGPVLQGAWSMISAVLNNIKTIWLAGWSVIGTILLGAWNAITIVISTALNVIRGIIQVVTSLIHGDWNGVWQGIKTIFSSVWDGIKALAGNAINTVWSILSTVLNTIRAVWSNTWNGIKGFFGGIWDGIKGAARAGVNGVIDTVRGIKDRITGFFGGAGRWLADAGRNIISGLLNGLKDKFEDVKNWVGGIGDWIKEHKGPKAYDLNLLVDNGGWIMQSLATGLKQGFDATVTPYVLSRGSALQNMISTPAFPSSAPAAAGRSVLSGPRVTQNNSFYSLDSNAVAREATRLAAHAIR